jgi:hypothetical protein
MNLTDRLAVNGRLSFSYMPEDAQGRILYLTVERTAVDDLLYVGKVSVWLPASSGLLRQLITVMVMLVRVRVIILMMVTVGLLMITVMTPMTVFSGMVMVMIMTGIGLTVTLMSWHVSSVRLLFIKVITTLFRQDCNLCARDTVPLVSGDLKIPSLQFQFFQSFNQDIAVNAQVEHRPEVHVTAYSRKTVIYCNPHH